MPRSRPADAQPGPPLPPLGPQDMAPHRAGYTRVMSIGEAEEAMRMTGRMSREVLAGCDSWTIRERISVGTEGRLSAQRFGFTIEKELQEARDGRRRGATGKPPETVVWANGVLGDIAGGHAALMGIDLRLSSVDLLPSGC